ncbi:MAG: exo-alpha-sialidase [Thermoplasmatota archaeon]
MLHSPMTFINYPAPESLPGAHSARETSIGVDPKTNTAMFQELLNTARIHWDDSQIPPVAAWSDVTFAPNTAATLDPILYVDPSSGRTFVSQLLGPTSQVSISDDDGTTWVEAQPPVTAPSIDHQNIGGGPYISPLGGVMNQTPDKTQLYYCAQLAITQCAASYDGGLTWNAPVPIQAATCVGLVGHAHGAPDGTIFVPDQWCSGTQSVIVSQTMGASWSIRHVPGVGSTNGDPSVAIDGGGKTYFSTASNGHAVVVTSTDDGLHWAAPVDVGAPFNIVNTEFTMATAGDAGRAAVAFYGSPTPGDDQSSSYTGIFELYIAYTIDGGATWTTVDATPGDPVQRGCIWMNGGSNPCRNLLDFETMTVDAEGRILVGYGDGCTSAQCKGPDGQPSDSRDSLGVIARETTGPRMYAAFDPNGPDPLLVQPGGPYLVDVGVPANLTALAAGGIPPYTFAWDLNNDGNFSDATGPTATFPGSAGGSYPVALRLTDSIGETKTVTTYVRVRDPAREALVHAWDFDADATCGGTLGTNASEGWSSPESAGLPTDALTWHLGVGGADASPCAWVNAMPIVGQYPAAQDTRLFSPGNAGCFEFPASAVIGRLEFRVSGVMENNFDHVYVETVPCGGSTFTRVLSLTGIQGANDPGGFATYSADLSPLVGAGPFQVVFHSVTDSSNEAAGYALDAFRLYEQN